MKATSKYQGGPAGGACLLLVLLLCLATPGKAKDTDIYAINTKQNCYVLMDSSGSMNFGVYQHTIDYGAMFDYLFTLKDGSSQQDYIWDTINNSNIFYKNHKPARRIYLWKGEIGATIATIDGKSVAFSGDAADPNYLWYSNELVDTFTLIDANGNLVDDGSGKRRLTVDAEGYVLLDGTRLPLGLDIKEHDFATLYNGTVVDNGFAGLLNAPGYYFSGYEGVVKGSLNQVEHGDDDVYFFVTGNWANMQAMYNLHYALDSNPQPTGPKKGAQKGGPAWPYELFPLASTVSWTQLNQTLDYPEGSGNYANNRTEANTARSIVAAGAQKIQVHFSLFDVQGNNNVNNFNNDYVALYDQTGTLVAKYDNDNRPTTSAANDPGGETGWSPIITGNTATLKLKSNNSTTGQGYTIDKIRVVYETGAGDSYLMQSRMDVAKDAMLYVVDEFRGKMNWGFARFKNGDGAQVGPYLNPTDNDDTNRAAIVQQIENVTPLGGTPLMEALQDVWQDGYYGRRNVLDSLLCRKNYVISMTDGYPSVDIDASRVPLKGTFTDADGDGWTSDPYQAARNNQTPAPNFYDDVAHWMYTHSWLDGSEVTDPANSYVNVMTHHIAFGAKQPLLEDAAGESGGEYIVAYNKEQLIAAFYSLALMMSESVSFTAPVVSVDAVNKIQSGDDLYMGLFLPMDSTYWAGNVKKFKMGDGSTERPELFNIYDKKNAVAIDGDGQFLDNTAAFWGDDTDPNDTDNYGAADIKEDGAGEVLLEDVQGYFTAGATDPAAYWQRPVYTWMDHDGDGTKEMVKFDRTHITAAHLGVVDDVTRDKLVNFVHGYSYDAVAATGAPLAVRDWILGPIIHSRPVVIDYFDTSQKDLPLQKRLIAVGSNDGMLHVFDDENGRELFAFIPEDILPLLKEVQANKMFETVDGLITLFRRDKAPKYLIFGERRGGSTFWNLDITNQDPTQWTVRWSYTHPQIQQSWSEVKTASIPVAINAQGERTFKDVAIFTGGYDTEEDFFPEPFTDQDANGTPFAANGSIDNKEWAANTASQDVYDDNQYNRYNPAMNEYGRGIFVVDLDDPAAATSVAMASGPARQILPFSATYGATAVNTGVTQTFPEMRFSFPASPSVATGTDRYLYNSASGPAYQYADNVLLAAYGVDIYANLFKVRYDFKLENAGTTTTPDWKVTSTGWAVSSLFSGNPGSASASGRMGAGVNASDQGRKAFYPPAISWRGSKGYFEAGNYVFPNVRFDNTDTMASLFFGTGDRENPKYTMIRNRFYTVYDDASVTATQTVPPPDAPVAVTSAPYQENDLLNLTCDELDKDTSINSCYLGPLGGACDATDTSEDMKTYLRSLLKDDAVYGTPVALEKGPANENDAKGWYIVLPDQGQSLACGHVSYPTTIDSFTSTDHDNHIGEHVLSQATLYYGTLYFTTYQPSGDDPCNPQGNGFSYALNYLDASATYDLTETTVGNYDITDRYKKFTGIHGIPSGFTIVVRDGHAAAMASMGGAIIGPGPDPANPFEIETPGLGLELYYWRDSSSEQ